MGNIKVSRILCHKPYQLSLSRAILAIGWGASGAMSTSLVSISPIYMYCYVDCTKRLNRFNNTLIIPKRSNFLVAVIRITYSWKKHLAARTATAVNPSSARRRDALRAPRCRRPAIITSDRRVMIERWRHVRVRNVVPGQKMTSGPTNLHLNNFEKNKNVSARISDSLTF